MRYVPFLPFGILIHHLYFVAGKGWQEERVYMVRVSKEKVHLGRSSWRVSQGCVAIESSL
jgi:hypothetical protein